MLNSDSESVLLKGLRTFARQIRLEHGLVAEDDRRERAAERAAALKEEVEAEMGTAMKVDNDSGSSGSSSDGAGSSSGSDGEEEEAEEGEEEGGAGEEKAARRGGSRGGRGSGRDGHREALLLKAAEKGEAPGLLGEYLRGSPQLNDLLRLWDLDERKVKSFSDCSSSAVGSRERADERSCPGRRETKVRGPP